MTWRYEGFTPLRINKIKMAECVEDFEFESCEVLFKLNETGIACKMRLTSLHDSYGS